MFKNSIVSPKGRWIITAIFAVCVVFPELLVIATTRQHANARLIICFATIRLIWTAPLYYYTMMGYTWARNVTIALLVLGAVTFLSFIDAETYLFLVPPLAFAAAGATILLYLDEVKSKEFRRRPARR